MSGSILTDRAIHDALLPDVESSSIGLASSISAGIRERDQRRAFRWPWQLGADATAADAARVRTLRVALVVAAVSLTLVVAAVGARLLRSAPPQLFIGRNGQIMSIPIAGGDLQPLLPFAGKDMCDVSISADNRRLLSMECQAHVAELWDATAVLLDQQAESRTVAMPPDTIIRDLGFWLPDSRHALIPVSRHGLGELYRIDVDTGQAVLVSWPGVAVGNFALSPDETKLVIAGQRANRYSLYLVDLASLTTTVLVEGDADRSPVGDLAWTPDGTGLIFSVQELAISSLWIVDADGSNARRLVAGGDRSFAPMWASSSLLLFHTWKPPIRNLCNFEIDAVNVETGEVRTVSDRAFALSWKEEGKTFFADYQRPLDGAPYGGVVSMRLDGTVEELFVPYQATDSNTEGCRWYSLWARKYGGTRAATGDN